MSRVYKKDLDDMYKAWQYDMKDIREAGFTVRSRNRFITLDYACLLLRQLKDNLDRKHGEYYDSEMVSNFLRAMDWEYYSFSGKACEGDVLIKALMVSKKEAKDVVGMLDIQTMYLEKASTLIADILGGD